MRAEDREPAGVGLVAPSGIQILPTCRRANKRRLGAHTCQQVKEGLQKRLQAHKTRKNMSDFYIDGFSFSDRKLVFCMSLNIKKKKSVLIKSLESHYLLFLNFKLNV